MELTGQEESRHAEKSDPVLKRMCGIYRELLLHDGFGDMRVDIRILKRGQKEVIISSGKQYRYVVDVPNS
ncbi:MAG: hypothetical protein LBU34_09950 [Planctomycetaceae bacterium]|jgi:hypothetical protein|nr:hypothetical protein [Planctomycetaceae bacterium]